MRQLLVWLGLGLGGLVCAQGPTYYIDFAAGDDNWDGLSPATAWKHLPGTRSGSLWQSAYVTTNYGQGVVVAGSRPMPPGTVLKLKGGGTQTAASGGAVLIGRDFYSQGTAEAPLVIERDLSWGNGPVVFDGAGVPLVKWEVQWLVRGTDHVHIQGNGPGGIVFRNSPRGGVAVFGSAESPLRGMRLSGITVAGCHDAAVAGNWLDGYEVTGVEVDGQGLAGNGGFHFGEQPCHNGLFRDCVAHGLGDEPGAQSGGTDIQIGFWTVNSRHVSYVNCTAYDNEGDGFDVGLYHATADNATDDIRYVNCLSFNNADGFGANAGESLPHTMRIYYVNAIAYGNRYGGFHAYGGTAEYWYVHVVAVGNRDGNFHLGPDGWQDTTRTVVRIRNSVGYKPDTAARFHKANMVTVYTKGSKFRLDSDYNYWAGEAATPNFCNWDCYAGTAPRARAYTYAGGPGSETTDWWALDEDGHLHCDAHSLNGGTVGSAGFADEAEHDYRLAETSVLRGRGSDLSREPWYLPEMGRDRAGQARTKWSIGAYE